MSTRVATLAYIDLLGMHRTLVIIFAPLTLVHVMIAIYVSHIRREIGNYFLTCLCTARVFRPSPRSLANVRQACSHARRGRFHLRVVSRARTLLR